MTRTRLLLSLLLVTVLAALLRFRQLDQLPPGLWFDEGWVTLAARDGGNPVYFAASFGGMHPAVVYLTRLALLISDNPRVIRTALAFVGTLSVPLGFFCYRAIFRLDSRERADTTALLAALLLAILYPFLHFSRLGFESLLPLPAALLAFWLLALPFAWWRIGLLGLVLGLSIYTFDTGRFIPLAAAAAYWFALAPRAGAAAVSEPGGRLYSTLLRRFTLLVTVALLIGAPLLGYFAQNWDQLTARAAVTTYNTFGPGAASVPLALLSNLGRTLAGISLPGFGDQIARHNLPGRPVLDPFISLFFWLGLVISVRDGLGRGRLSPASGTLFWWLAVGLLPVVLTDGAPTYTRLFVAAPALPPIAAAGGIRLLTWGNRRWRYAGSAAVGLLLLLGFNQTLTDYFSRWPQNPQLYDDFQVAQWTIAGYGRSQPSETRTYFIPQTPYAAEPLYDLLTPSPRALPPPPCLVLPPAGAAAVIMADQRLARGALAPYQAIYPKAAVDTPLRHPVDGGAILTTLALPASSEAILQGEPLAAAFGEAIRLQTWSWDGQLLRLVWEAAAPPGGEHTFFLHLYPAGEEDAPPLWQLDRPPCYPTGRWQTGERIIDEMPLFKPEGVDLESITLAIGWYDSATLARLPLTADPDQVLPDDRLILPLRSQGGD